MVQVVGGHDLVFYTFVIHLNGMFSVIASEDEQVFHCELLGLGPTDLQTRLLQFPFLFQRLGVQQIEHFFVVYLQEARIDIDSFCALSRLSLVKHLPYGSHSESVIATTETTL